MINDNAVPKDSVGEQLNSINLKSDPQGDSEEGKEQGKLFKLCPLYSMRGRFHAIRSNYLIHLLHGTSSYKKNLTSHPQTPTKWQSDIFYVNEFFRNDDYQ